MVLVILSLLAGDSPMPKAQARRRLSTPPTLPLAQTTQTGLWMQRCALNPLSTCPLVRRLSPRRQLPGDGTSGARNQLQWPCCWLPLAVDYCSASRVSRTVWHNFSLHQADAWLLSYVGAFPGYYDCCWRVFVTAVAIQRATRDERPECVDTLMGRAPVFSWSVAPLQTFAY